MSSPYTSGPFESMSSFNGGWVNLDMAELQRLIYFGRSSSEVQAVFQVCYRSLLSGIIQINSMDGSDLEEPVAATKKPAAAAAGAKKMIEWEITGDTLPVYSQRKEAANRSRSSMWGSWATEAELIDNCIGWVPVTAVPNTTHLDIVKSDPMRPVVLNFDKMRIRFRRDVYNTAQFEFYEIVDPLCGDAFQSHHPFPGTRRIHNVQVIGNEMPASDGTIMSRIKRIYYGSWRQYCSKAGLTILADGVRAKPPVVTKEKDNHGREGPNAVRVSVDPQFNARGSLSESAMDRINAVHALVLAENANCAATSAQAQVRQQQKLMQFELDPGRDVAATHMAEAPAELMSMRQAFLEDVCLSFGVPMPVLSAGDASGKAKLNSASAGEGTSRIFRDAQADRKRRMENHIQALYTFMYGERRVWFVLKATKKRARDEVDDGADETRKEEAGNKAVAALSIAELERCAQVTVSIPCNPDWQELFDAWKNGIIRYEPLVVVGAEHFGLSVSAFQRKQAIACENLLGIAPPQPVPPPPAAAAGGGGASKKKKKKKAKTGTAKKK